MFTELSLFCFLPSFLIVIFFLLGSHLWHMEVPGLWVKLELQLLAYTTVAAILDLSCIYDLPLSLYQHRFLFFFCFLGPHSQHMEVLRLGVTSELQLLAYTIATAMQDPSCIGNLYHNSRQHQIH